MNRDSVDGLQILRAVAALSVVFGHCLSTLVSRGAADLANADQIEFGFGKGGVYLFFGISGYVMTLTTRARFQKPGALRAFISRRIWRIVPPYWLATSAYFLILMFKQEAPPLSNLAQSFLFVPFFDSSGLIRPVLGQGWTLIYEMYFYLAFALALLLPRSVALPMLCAWFVLSATAGVLGVGRTDNAWSVLLTNPVLLYFCVGIGVALFAERIRPNYPPIGWLAVATVGMIALGSSFWFGSAGLVTSLAAIAALLYAATFTSFLPYNMAGRAGLAVGAASYSIYLSHTFIIGPFTRVWSALALPTHGAGIILVSLATMAVCAVLGYFVFLLIETPILNRLRPIQVRLQGAAP